MIRVTEFNRLYKTSTPNGDAIKRKISSLPSHAMTWYTDGSKTLRGTGAGIVGPRFNYRGALSSQNTVFQAQAWAIEICAIECLRRKYKNTEIYIISSSQAVIMALCKSNFNSKLIYSCHQSLNRVACDNKLMILWAPAHENIKGNIKARDLARAGTQDTFFGPEPAIPNPSCCMTTCIKIWVSGERDQYWRSLPGQSNTRRFFSQNIIGLENVINMDRKELRQLSWYVSGHGPFNTHLQKMNRANTAECRFCNAEKEKSTYLLFECEALSEKRGRHFCTKEKIKTKTRISFDGLVNFIKELNLNF